MIIYGVDKGEPLKVKGDLTVLWEYGSLQDFGWCGAEQVLEARRWYRSIRTVELKTWEQMERTERARLLSQEFWDEKGSWIQGTTHPMGGASVVSMDPLPGS